MAERLFPQIPFLGEKKNLDVFLIAPERKISFSIVAGCAVALVRRTNTEADFCQFFIGKWQPTSYLHHKVTARIKIEAEWSIFHCRLHTRFFVLASKPIIFRKQLMRNVTDFHVFLCARAVV